MALFSPSYHLAVGAFLRSGKSMLVRRKGPRWFVANWSSWPSLLLKRGFSIWSGCWEGDRNDRHSFLIAKRLSAFKVNLVSGQAIKPALLTSTSTLKGESHLMNIFSLERQHKSQACILYWLTHWGCQILSLVFGDYYDYWQHTIIMMMAKMTTMIMIMMMTMMSIMTWSTLEGDTWRTF